MIGNKLNYKYIKENSIDTTCMRTLWEPSEWNNIGYCSDTILYKILLSYVLRHDLSGKHDSVIALRLIRLNIVNLNQAEHVKLKS